MATEKVEKVLVRSRSFTQSLELMENLHGAGYAIVPIHPTPEMLEAGARASELVPSTVERIYRAMLLAAGREHRETP